MSSAVTGADQALEFDLDYANRDYRRIFDKRNEYFAAVRGDEVRMGQLQHAIEQVQKVEFAVRTAREQIELGEDYAAWEMLVSAGEFAKRDPEYNQLMVRLAPKVSDLARHLESGEAYEERGLAAPALAQYLVAREVYPGSMIARQAMERLGPRLLESAVEVEGPDAATGQ